MADSIWWVYVIQSLNSRAGGRPGFYYVGCTTDPARRIRQHNGELKGGSRFTSKHRPHEMRAIWGPYPNRSEAMKAERALKKGKRGSGRCRWTPDDSPWCRGLGTQDSRVEEINIPKIDPS